jgi:4-amino-4-deoxy-L-arabinose transferase-like glycosyltransferase
MLKKINIFWIFTGTLFLVILLPGMVQQGMFLDGITYSAISKNLANGIGNFWNPHYTNTLYPSFYEHPPLVFGIQSLFFKIFGDSFLTERIFSFCNCLLSSFAIYLIWSRIFKGTEYQKFAWLPLFFWIITPIISWSFKNNLLENTLSVFTLFALFFQIESVQKKSLFSLVLGSICIVAAFLSKGFVGLFPLATLLIYAFVFKEFKNKKMVLYSILSLILPLLLLIFLYWIIPGFKNNFDHYLNQQLIPALNNQREITTTSHFGLLIYLLIQLLLPFIILFIILVFRYIKKSDLKFDNTKMAQFFLLIGLSASLPLMITLKQRPFYLVPSLPFYILSFSCFIVSIPNQKIGQIKKKNHFLILIFSSLVIIITLVSSWISFGKIARDYEIIQDVTAISNEVPKGTTIQTTKKIWENWVLTAYLSRYQNISLDCNQEQEYLLYSKPTTNQETLLTKYNLTTCNLRKYKLYKKKEP